MKRLLVLTLVAVLLAGCAAGGTTETTASTQPAQLGGAFPQLGGTMPEMAFTTADGRDMTLSALLEEKELVVLNFWFENCPWCIREFSVMELAYQQYRQDVEVVALNPSDGAQRVKAFQEKSSLSFPMVACPRAWAVEAGVSAYPTSVFIDRDGVVCLIHVGAITTTDAWYTVFDAFTGEDYQRKLYRSVNELLQ